MASNSSICGICLPGQTTKTSKHWCPQCEEALCNECMDYHKLLKATRSHEPIPMSNYMSIPSFITDIQQSCVYHNEQYQQYCVEHASPMCFKCINDHRKCNVITLEKVTNNVKTSEQFLDLESRLEDLLQNIDRINKDQNANMTKIKKMKTRHVKEFRQKRFEIIKYLDILEKQIIKDLEEKECQNKESIQKVLSSVKEKETIITQCQANIQNIKQYASDLQTFLGMREIEVKVYENEQYLQSLYEVKRLEQLDIVVKVEPVVQSILSSLKKFGSIEMKTQTSNIEFTRTKDKQKQLQVATTKNIIHDVRLNLWSKITTDGQEIRGCCISEKGDILFTCHHFKKLITVFASNSKLKDIMLLDHSYGFDLTLMDEKTVAITSGASRMKVGIDILDIKNRTKIKFIELSSRT
ncbi:unnamed protein product [Mytilus coruscus]|uniref:B box-type domain-containing protein n=1 Tax=Mytilus coruscus TaxID=42192 RepID=A0A6J8BL90_MYTCO|nr:unnamed protein product [Mytilus coruscus]